MNITVVVPILVSILLAFSGCSAREGVDPQIAEAQSAWNALLRAMQNEDAEAISRLTTSGAIPFLEDFKEPDRPYALRTWANYLANFEASWHKCANSSDVECRIGPEWEEATLRFTSTPEGWKLCYAYPIR